MLSELHSLLHSVFRVLTRKLKLRDGRRFLFPGPSSRKDLPQLLGVLSFPSGLASNCGELPPSDHTPAVCIPHLMSGRYQSPTSICKNILAPEFPVGWQRLWNRSQGSNSLLPKPASFPSFT